MRAALLLLGMLAGAAPAQDDPSALQEHLDLLRQRLASRQADEERLIDLLYRHNLGFSVRGDRFFMLPADEPRLPLDQAEEQLRREEAELASLADRLDRLSGQLERVRSGQPVAALEPVAAYPDAEPVTIPQADSAPPRPFGGVSQPDPGTATEEAPGGDRAAPRDVSQIEAASLIRATENRGAIVRSLYAFAASLLEEARELRKWGRSEEAAALDQRARGRLEVVLRELEPLLAVEEPAYADLFQHGKCLEALFYLDTLHGDLKAPGRSKTYAEQFEAMRQPYLSIMARDVRQVGGATQVGPWGQSAQTALRHIRWMNDFGDYRPKIPIDSIRWNRK